MQERLNIPAGDLKAEANKLVKAIRRAKKMAEENPVEVSVSPRGRVRRNGPCPCGSGDKFKHCCAEKVKMGALKPLRMRK